MTKSPRILIAGAGIAGVTTAIALLRRGFDVEIFEQAPELREVGAGLQIGPNGSRVLIDLGLDSCLRGVVSEASAKEVRHWSTGETWKLFDLGRDCIERFGAPYWMVHRADFHLGLLSALGAIKPDAVRLGAEVTDVRQDAEGVSVMFADGRAPVHGAALIASDGVHSAVRRALGHTDRPTFTGMMAWRGVGSAERLPDAMRRSVGVNWVGPGRHVITYPLRGGQLFNFVGIIEGRDWPIESWTERGTFEECLADFDGWHPEVLQTIRNLEAPFKWALAGREPLSVWAHGRTCLIGDACHPTLPFLAQGANMAIEDAMVLARCLEAGASDIEGALKRFEALRIERTSMIVHRSREMAARFHNPVLADPVEAARYINAEWEPERVRTRYDWLYEYDAVSLDLGL